MLKQVWKCKTMAPRVQTFAWHILHRAIPTGARAGRYTTHISKFCCRCNAEEDDIHMLFSCPFARAAWFAEPWCIRSDSLIHNTVSITDVVQSLLAMNHPYASLQNIFTFLWCLSKSRNDCLFNRKPGSPLQVRHATQAIIQAQALTNAVISSNSPTEVHRQQSQNLPALGNTIKSDLFITGTKIFSDASWRACRIPSAAGQQATGVGVFLQFNEHGVDYNLMVQASTPSATSPLQAEAKALLFVAIIAGSLQFQHPTFLTDNLQLAKAAADRRSTVNHLNWDIRAPISEFFDNSATMEPRIYHISREINGVAHNCAHQALRNSQASPDFRCINKLHGHLQCPVVATLQALSSQDFVIHCVLCS